jgi:formylmethanofuran:tetrahydromethanopterin formyltransferase
MAAKAAATDREVAQVQLDTSESDALADGIVEETDKKTGKKQYYVKLLDSKFKIADKIGAMPMLKWAAASELSEDDPAALGAIYTMLQDVIHEDVWTEFEKFATKSKVDAEDLVNVISHSLEVLTGNPTKPQSGSHTGSASK